MIELIYDIWNFVKAKFNGVVKYIEGFFKQGKSDNSKSTSLTDNSIVDEVITIDMPQRSQDIVSSQNKVDEKLGYIKDTLNKTTDNDKLISNFEELIISNDQIWQDTAINLRHDCNKIPGFITSLKLLKAYEILIQSSRKITNCKFLNIFLLRFIEKLDINNFNDKNLMVNIISAELLDRSFFTIMTKDWQKEIFKTLFEVENFTSYQVKNLFPTFDADQKASTHAYKLSKELLHLIFKVEDNVNDLNHSKVNAILDVIKLIPIKDNIFTQNIMKLLDQGDEIKTIKILNLLNKTESWARIIDKNFYIAFHITKHQLQKFFENYNEEKFLYLIDSKKIFKPKNKHILDLARFERSELKPILHFYMLCELFFNFNFKIDQAENKFELIPNILHFLKEKIVFKAILNAINNDEDRKIVKSYIVYYRDINLSSKYIQNLENQIEQYNSLIENSEDIKSDNIITFQNIITEYKNPGFAQKLKSKLDNNSYVDIIIKTEDSIDRCL